MEKRSMRRSTMRDEIVVADTSMSQKKVGRPKKIRSSAVVVPATIEESPRQDLNKSSNKIMKEASVMLRKLSPTTLRKNNLPDTVLPKIPEPTAKAKRTTRSTAPSTPTSVKMQEQERILDKDERSTISTISSVSTAPTVDITAASNEGGDMLNQAATRLNNYIRESATRTLEEATKTIRRSFSRAPSAATSVGLSVAESESRYSRSVSRSHYDDEYSDTEQEQEQEQQAHYLSEKSEYFDTTKSFLCRAAIIPSEFAGAWGQACLLLLVPLLTSYLVLAAGKFTPQLPKDNDYLKLLSHIFPIDVVLAYLYYQCFLFILSGILVSLKVRFVSEYESVEWSFNALPLAVSANLAMAALSYYGDFNVVNFVLKHEWRFCIMGLVHAFVTAFWTYIGAKYIASPKEQINVYGKSGNIITDFALGRLINPKAFNFINYKQYAYRAQLITTLLLVECYLLKNMHWPAQWLELGQNLWKICDLHSGVFCAGILLLVYVLDSIIFEHHLASSFELQGEGFGCLALLRYAATPYLLSSWLRYSYKRKITLNCDLAFYAAGILLLIGLAIKRYSSALKYKYRLNPNHPIFKNMPSIHTYQARRLLLGAFWGSVRQPNYAGDILALIALCLPFARKNIWQAHLGILLIIIILLHRAVRVNERNRQRYYSSWARYTQQVRSYIVPKIF